MVLTVVPLAFSGVFLFGLLWGLAILIAGMLRALRFGLTSEAGLNDGSAFPFVVLGFTLLTTSFDAPVGVRQLEVPTIECEGCVETIRSALSQREGVEAVNGDSARTEITVTFNPERLGEAEILRVAADAGFLVGK